MTRTDLVAASDAYTKAAHALGYADRTGTHDVGANPGIQELTAPYRAFTPESGTARAAIYKAYLQGRADAVRKGITVAHAILKPKPGEVAAHRASCTCGLVLIGVGRKDAAESIRRHASQRNGAITTP